MIAVGKIVRNEAGQIHIEGPYGNPFDMSQFVGEMLYIHNRPIDNAEWIVYSHESDVHTGVLHMCPVGQDPPGRIEFTRGTQQWCERYVRNYRSNQHGHL